MSESIEESPSEDKNYTAFMLLEHDQDWSGTVEKGIPLLERLVKAGDTEKAAAVRRVLGQTRTVMEYSSAGDAKSREFLRERIKRALDA